MNVTAGFGAVMVPRKSRIHAGFRKRANARCVGDRRTAALTGAKSRSLAHRAKCEKSLSGNIFGAAADEILFECDWKWRHKSRGTARPAACSEVTLDFPYPAAR